MIVGPLEVVEISGRGFRRQFLGHTNRVYSVAFHPTRPEMASAGFESVR